jgi:anti-anti-sigma regulatory factor
MGTLAEDLEKNPTTRMLRIQRVANGDVVFTLSGRMDEEDIPELETLIRSEGDGRRIVLDLKDLTLIGRDAISFLERWEAKGIALANCADYVREWIARQRRGS